MITIAIQNEWLLCMNIYTTLGWHGAIEKIANR